MQEILTVLKSLFLFDIWVFSQWWTYVFILPIFVYIPFFFLKWIVLTAPLWMPVTIILNSIFKREEQSKQPRAF